MGSDFRIGALLTVGVVLALAGPVMAQSISVDLDRNTAGIQSSLTVGTGGTIQGSLVVEGLPAGNSAYRGHSVRVQIVPDSLVGNPVTSTGDIAFVAGALPGSGIPFPTGGARAISALGYFFFGEAVVQTSPPITDITAFPATLFGFDITVGQGASGTYTLNIIDPDDGLAPQVSSGLSLTSPEGVVPVELFALNNGTVSIAGGPTPTSTPTPTGPTPTPEEPTPTPTPTEPIPESGYIVLDGFGGMHSIGVAPSVTGNGLYYPGIDIVVDLEILPDNSGVVVIDDMGFNFVFGLDGSTPSIPVNPFYIPDFPDSLLPPRIPDPPPSYVAVEAADDSAGYWVLNDMGQIYGVGSVLPAGATQSLLPELSLDQPLPAYNPNETNFYNPDGTPIIPVPDEENPGPGWFSAVDFVVVNDGEGVVVAGRWGEQHLIGNTSAIGMCEDTVHPYFGWDIVRAIEIEPQNKGYMLLDGFGAVHPVPSRPEQGGGPVREAYNLYVRDGNQQPYFGWDVAESIAYAADGMGWVTLDAFGGTHYVGQITDVRVLYFGWDIARDIEIYVPTAD